MDFTKPIKSQYVWCIDCQEEVILDLGLLDGTPVHTIETYSGSWDEPPEWEPCCGPFATCPHPLS